MCGGGRYDPWPDTSHLTHSKKNLTPTAPKKLTPIAPRYATASQFPLLAGLVVGDYGYFSAGSNPATRHLTHSKAR